MRIFTSTLAALAIAMLAVDRPAQSQTPVAPPSTEPLPPQIGAWKIIVDRGHLVAMAKREKPDGDHLAGIRLECTASGRLEYVPVALRGAISTLWVNGMDDNSYTIQLVNGRVSGNDNTALSKEFQESEANYKRNGRNDWGIQMSIDGPDTAMENIKMSGFAQVRSYMLANCRKQG